MEMFSIKTKPTAADWNHINEVPRGLRVARETNNIGPTHVDSRYVLHLPERAPFQVARRSGLGIGAPIQAGQFSGFLYTVLRLEIGTTGALAAKAALS